MRYTLRPTEYLDDSILFTIMFPKPTTTDQRKLYNVEIQLLHIDEIIYAVSFNLIISQINCLSIV